jgi:transposase
MRSHGLFQGRAPASVQSPELLLRSSRDDDDVLHSRKSIARLRAGVKLPTVSVAKGPKLGRDLAEVKIKLRALLARQNREAPYKVPFGRRGLAWFRQQDFGPIGNLVRDELLGRLEHYDRQISILDRQMAQVQPAFPQTEVLTEIYGVGLFSALLIVAELGEMERFRWAKQVGAYAGLTSRVRRSGDHCYRGSITRQGSPWLRWILVEAAMKAIRRDVALRNFYTRVRKRASAKIARVASARKLAEICWKRLRRWQRDRAGKAAWNKDVVPRTKTVVCGPEKGLAGVASAVSNDWALRPVNNILCAGQQPREARMGVPFSRAPRPTHWPRRWRTTRLQEIGPTQVKPVDLWPIPPPAMGEPGRHVAPSPFAPLESGIDPWHDGAPTRGPRSGRRTPASAGHLCLRHFSCIPSHEVSGP